MDQNEKQFDTVAGGASSIAEEARKKLRWALLSLVLAALTIHAVSAQWKDFSFAAFLEDLQQAINENGVTDSYQNGANQSGMKASADLQAYNSLAKVYNALMDKLSAKLPKMLKQSRLAALRDE